MDFIEKLQALAVRIPKQLEYCKTEEATKNALIMPFISALGYDVFNPTEVVPEFTADIGTKKGEKVDYAILQDDVPIILFECKWSGADLNNEHASQLFRYFAAVPEVRFGVLTNGVSYRFYSDLESPNRLDDRPFFEFDAIDFDDRKVAELKKFTKSSFDLDDILTTASELKYTAAIQRIIAKDFDEPSDDLVRYLASQVYSGRMTKSTLEQFSEIVHKALRRFMNDQISARLKTALNSADSVEPSVTAVESEATEDSDVQQSIEEIEDGVVRQDKSRGIFTTEDEIEAFFAVKSVLRDLIDVGRVHMRDGKTYCSVLLDDSNRKPICRFRFDGTQKYLGILDNDKKETRTAIDAIDDIYSHAELIAATVQRYDADTPVPAKSNSRPVSNKPPSDRNRRYTGTKPVAVKFLGDRISVNSWREAMFAFLSSARSQDSATFDRVAIQMVGRKRPYITPDKEQLRSAELIPGSALYVETNLDASGIAKLCRGISDAMGNGPDALAFEIDV